MIEVIFNLSSRPKDYFVNTPYKPNKHNSTRKRPTSAKKSTPQKSYISNKNENNKPSDPRYVLAKIVKKYFDEKSLLQGKDYSISAMGGDSYKALSERDKRFVERIIDMVLRRRGDIMAILSHHLERGIPPSKGFFLPCMLGAIAELKFLGTQAHAVLNSYVEIIKKDRLDKNLAKLANGVLRSITRYEGEYDLDPGNNIPEFFKVKWSASYGKQHLKQIAKMTTTPPHLDLCFKTHSQADDFIQRLKEDKTTPKAISLNQNQIRFDEMQNVKQLPAYDEGSWWVQDFAASLAVNILKGSNDLKDKSLLDACAAPGGKTAQLAAYGAKVDAVDISKKRLDRLKQNLSRLKLEAKSCKLDLLDKSAITNHLQNQYDGVLIDAPCSATGTLRRHPDVLYLKNQDSIETLVKQQSEMLDNLSALVKKGGILLYAVCSLEKEEGEEQIKAFLQKHKDFQLIALNQQDFGIKGATETDFGLRIFPDCEIIDKKGNVISKGMEGFFIAKLWRT